MAPSKAQLASAFQVLASQTRATAGGGVVATHAVATNEVWNENENNYLYGPTDGTTLGLGDDFTMVCRYYGNGGYDADSQFMGVGTYAATQANSYLNGVAFGRDGADDFAVKSYTTGPTWNVAADESFFSNLGTALADNEYVTIAVVYDGSAASVSFYYNGSLVATDTSQTSHATLTDANDRVLFIANGPHNSSLYSYGYFTHFAFYSAKLSANSIAALEAGGNSDWRS